MPSSVEGACDQTYLCGWWLSAWTMNLNSGEGGGGKGDVGVCKCLE